jgi:hypothetical protein
MHGGNGGVMVSRTTTEQEIVREKILLSVVRESTRPNILVCGT